jgi:aminopeptidase N
VDLESEKFMERLEDFGLDEEFISGFDEPVHCFEFVESPRISSYLYAFIAGPYVCVESDREEIKNFKHPLRLFCRKSLVKYVEKTKDDIFTASKGAIEFYEDFF